MLNYEDSILLEKIEKEVGRMRSTWIDSGNSLSKDLRESPLPDLVERLVKLYRKRLEELQVAKDEAHRLAGITQLEGLGYIGKGKTVVYRCRNCGNAGTMERSEWLNRE